MEMPNTANAKIVAYKDKLDLTFDLVQLTKGQYNKLIWLWGKDKTDKCIKILNDWLKEKGDKITKKISHYRQIIGWVERKYYQLYPTNDKSLRFDSKIDTLWKAKKYVERIPKELRAYDSEIKYLVERFGIDVIA
jgi:hypothetical protein